MILSITILNYNTSDLILKCLSSLVKNYGKYIEKREVEIIVIDNASKDNSVEEIKKHFPQVILVENKENAGFSRGHNIASKIAKGKYLFFLNSDTISRDDHLLGMVSYLEKHQEVGIIGARLFYPSGLPQLSAGKFFTFINSVIMLFGLEKLQHSRFSPKQICEVDWVMGAAMLIRKELFSKLGGFDEHFFMYVEDMELCYRMKKIGKKTVFYTDAVIVHQELGSSNKGFAIVGIYNGMLYFFKKHGNFLQYVIIMILFMAKAFFAVTIGILTNNKNLVLSYKKILSS